MNAYFFRPSIFFVLSFFLWSCAGKEDQNDSEPKVPNQNSADTAQSNPAPPIKTSPSNKRYTKTTEGFFLKHFDNVGTRESCRDFGQSLARGGQPDLKSKKWVEKLRAEGITYIVDLRNEAGTEEEEATLKEGLGYLWIPIRTDGTAQRSSMNYKIRYLGQNTVTKSADPVTATLEIIYAIQSLTQKGHRVYIHCARGEDRTGIILGLLRKCDSWYSEFKGYGGSYYNSLKWLFENVKKSGKPY